MKKIFYTVFTFISLIDLKSQSPTFQWAGQFSGTGTELPLNTIADAFDNVYTVGYFNGTVDFDPGAGILNLSATGGSYDLYITKLDPSGNLLWAKTMGGTGSDLATSVCINAAGDIYVSGYFGTTVDFDPGPGVFTLSSASIENGFVEKLDASGNFLWVKQLGQGGTARISSATLDGMGNIFCVGTFYGPPDMDPGPGVFNLIYSGTPGYRDVYIAKLDASGNFLWANQITGNLNEYPMSIKADAKGNVYSTGHFNSTNTDFDPGVGSYTLAPSGTYDVFISKLDAAGNFKFAKTLGGNGCLTAGQTLAIDLSGNVYTSGYFNGTADFDPGALNYNLTCFGGSSNDAYISKLDSLGNFIWAKQIGGTGSDMISNITTDAAGNIFTTGSFNSTCDFDPGAGTFNLTSAGLEDASVLKLDGAGNFIWAVQMGGSAYDGGISISISSAGNIYTAGCYQGPGDFDPGAGTFNLTHLGSYDCFIHKMSPGTLGINEFKSKNSITIYPNPFNSETTLKFSGTEKLENAELIITDAKGAEIQKISGLNGEEIKLSLNNLTPGIYDIKLNTKNSTSSTKTIKQ